MIIPHDSSVLQLPAPFQEPLFLRRSEDGATPLSDSEPPPSLRVLPHSLSKPQQTERQTEIRQGTTCWRHVAAPPD